MSDDVKCLSCLELADAYHRTRVRCEELERFLKAAENRIVYAMEVHSVMDYDVPEMLLPDRVRWLLKERGELKAEVVKLRQALAGDIRRTEVVA